MKEFTIKTDGGTEIKMTSEMEIEIEIDGKTYIISIKEK